jgi:2-dehydro-3-deoxygluconokinase
MKTIAAFGEIMLRLSPPRGERLLQSPRLSAVFGGGEANVAVSLALLGHNVRYITALPDNDLGDAAVAELRKHAVQTEYIKRQGKRIGIYFAETGANQRPSKVIYDRENSAIAAAKPGDFDWTKILKDVDWFHTTGITPALSQNAADLTIEAVQTARTMGITVSLDLNFRSKLWKYGRSAPEIMREIVKFADIGIANEEDCQKSLGIEADVDVNRDKLDLKVYELLTQEVMAAFPNLSKMAVTVRESKSVDTNGWTAVLRTKEGFLTGKRYEITDIVDRIGSGDAFSAGVIHGLNKFKDDRETLIFATAASCLKHSIYGDFNLVSEEEILKLMRGDSSGRIQR